MQPQAYAEIRRVCMSAPDDDALLNVNQTTSLCGVKSRMCIWRWLHNPKVNFPQPIKISGRNYWRRRDVRHWCEKQASKIAT